MNFNRSSCVIEWEKLPSAERTFLIPFSVNHHGSRFELSKISNPSSAYFHTSVLISDSDETVHGFPPEAGVSPPTSVMLYRFA